MDARWPEVSHLRAILAVAVATLIATTTLALASPAAAPAATYPPGFSEQTVFSGLTNPTAIRFSSDGRVFVAEKSGLIKVFDSLADTQPDVFADLRTQVHNFWDRGLLGLALDPNFPANPYVYVLYTHDAAIGGTAPRWGTAGATFDGCPSPPGATADGCVVSGRLSRLTASGNSMTGHRAGADRGLVPAVSEPLDRLARLRPRRRPVRERRRRSQLQLRRLRPGREPAQPLRRPAGWRRCGPHPTDRRGRGAAQPGPAHLGRPHRSGRRAPARRPGDGSCASRQSRSRQRRSQRPPHRRLRDAQPVPIRGSSRHRRGLDRGRGLEHLGGDQPDPVTDRRGDQPRLALLRGRRPAGRL